MSTGRELSVVGQSIILSPAEIVHNATEQSKLLMSIVNKTECYQNISGKKYLQVEAWETIGAFNRVHAVTEWITPIMRDGILVGYDAKVNLIHIDGFIVGSAIMPCYFTENACKGKEGDAKDKACKSAAQTFATSKAYRMNYSYIAILAGYEPTPAEEMSINGHKAEIKVKQHLCPTHNVAFNRKEKDGNIWYSHKIKGTDDWCNEEDQQVSPPQEKPTVNKKSQLADFEAWLEQENIKKSELPELLESASLSDFIKQGNTIEDAYTKIKVNLPVMPF